MKKKKTKLFVVVPIFC